jgi:prolyl 4-hydroxylase
MHAIDDAWRDWLSLNKDRGCTAESMIEAMVEAGIDQSSASAAVHRSMEPGARGGTEARQPPPAPTDYQYDSPPVAGGNVIDVDGKSVQVLMRCEKPQIIAFSDLLSTDECETIINRSRHRLERSATVNPETGVAEVIPNRTSEGICFANGEDEFIASLERRFASLMNWPVENGEGLQVLRYGVGAEYRPHFDYFPPKQSGSAVHLNHGGQRVATLIVYLNDVEAGGETIFPEVNLSVVARRGAAVYFRYMNAAGQLDPMTLHGGAPVTRGEKWIMTKWVRERAYR